MQQDNKKSKVFDMRLFDGRDFAHAIRHAAMQRTVGDLARITSKYLVEFVSADRAECLLHDPDLQMLWHEDSAANLTTSKGIAGASATQRIPFVVQRAQDDPRYYAELDNPHGTPSDALVVQPVLDGQGVVQAIFIVARSAGASFTTEEISIIAAFAARVSVFFEAFCLEAESVTTAATAVAAESFFEPAALAAHREGKFYGESLELPDMMPISWYVLALIAFVALAALSCTARVNRYATGPASLLASEQLSSVYGDNVTGNRQSSLTKKLPTHITNVNDIDATGPIVVNVVMPARYRPTLQVGQEMRLALDGYPYAYQHMKVSFVSDQVVVPSESTELVGHNLAEAMQVKEPMIVVQGTLSGRTFSYNGMKYFFYAGMVGKASIRIDDESAIFTFIPFLRTLFEHD